MAQVVVPGKAEVIGSVESEVVALLRRARRRTGDRAHAIDPALASVGFQVLNQLDETPDVSQATLGEALGMDKGAVSRQVQLLGDLGLVEKRPDPEDGRACVVSLSAEGDRRMRALERERRTAYVARFDDWTAEELTVLAEQLAKYNRTLEK